MIDAKDKRIAELEALLAEANNKGLIYWEPQTERGAVSKADMMALTDEIATIDFLVPPPENPNAFPFAAEYGHPGACGGMTLRDYIAAKALPVLMSRHPADRLSKEDMARATYEFADAMLAARAAS